MSRQLLEALNGTNRGPLRNWLDRHEGEPRVAWYPSAGSDWRDLVYLGPQNAGRQPGRPEDASEPDLFLRTDFRVNPRSRWLEQDVLYQDASTEIRVLVREELPRCRLPLDWELVCLEPSPADYGRVVFMEVAVRSRIAGDYTVLVVYAVSENTAFCAHRLKPCAARISHLVAVCYGHLEGGSRADPAWLQSVMPWLGVETLISDTLPTYGVANEEKVFRMFPELMSVEHLGFEERYDLRLLHTFDGAEWSGYETVRWWRLDPRDSP